MAAEGKTLIYFKVLLYLITLYPLPSQTDTVLNSGLLFDRMTHREIPINGRKLSFSRRIGVQPLYNALEMLGQASRQYASACATATQRIKKKQDDYDKLVSDKGNSSQLKEPFKVEIGSADFLRLASTSCHAIKGQLFEVRSEFEHSLLTPLKGNYLIMVNTYFDQGAMRIRYVSDDSEPHRTTFKFKNYLDKFGHVVKHNDPKFLEEVRFSKLKMMFDHDNYVSFQTMSEKELDIFAKMPCKVRIEPIPLTKVPNNIDSRTVMECARDGAHLNNTYAALHSIIHETFDQTILQNPPGGPQNRSKRFAVVPAVALGIGASALAGNLISSSISGHAPLSYVGSGLSRIFGLVTDGQLEQTWLAIRNQSQQLSDLRLNMEEASQYFSEIQKAITQIQGYLVSQDLSLISYLQLKDLYHKSTTLAATIHTVVSSLIHALADSANGLYNPVVLTTTEVAGIKNRLLHTDQIEMDVSPLSIKTTLFRTPDHFYVIFLIPLIIPDDMGHIFSISSLPIFFQGAAFRPQLDTNYLALFTKAMEYAVLTSDEFQTCIRTPYQCQTAAARIPISDSRSCCAQTYQSHIQSCGLVASNETTPVFLIKDYQLFYSTPEPATVYATCRVKQQQYNEQKLQLAGLGSVTLPPDCTLLLPGKVRAKTPATVYTVDLPHHKLFDILEQFPNLTEYNRQVVYEALKFEPVPMTNFTQSSQFDFEQFFTETFHYRHQIKTLSPVLLALFIVASLLVFCCCICRPARQYCTSLWLCRPPDTWFAQVQNYTARSNRYPARVVRHWMTKASSLMPQNARSQGNPDAPGSGVTANHNRLYPTIPLNFRIETPAIEHQVEHPVKDTTYPTNFSVPGTSCISQPPPYATATGPEVPARTLPSTNGHAAHCSTPSTTFGTPRPLRRQPSGVFRAVPAVIRDEQEMNSGSPRSVQRVRFAQPLVQRQPLDQPTSDDDLDGEVHEPPVLHLQQLADQLRHIAHQHAADTGNNAGRQ
jgi:hypothetical protein